MPRTKNGDKEREKWIEEVHAIIDKELAASGLPDDVIEKYGLVAKGIVSNMRIGAARLLDANVKAWRFYPSHAGLTKAFKVKYPHANVTLLKGCFDKDGTLHLNDDGYLFGRKAPLPEFYAHEITHALDGTDHHVSKTDAWKNAWENEVVATEIFGDNGKSSTQEGFAEFGQLLLGTSVSRKQLKKEFKQCLNVWETHHL